MHEKFDVEHCGEFGGGGEYVPQVNDIVTMAILYHCDFWSRETFEKPRL